VDLNGEVAIVTGSGRGLGLAYATEGLAGCTVPRQVRVVDRLPATATGENRKPDLRDHFLNREETPA
jgi:NAD(P)-dependent dehydrogenase (short-subunit alcohol dehydrogenase family)